MSAADQLKIARITTTTPSLAELRARVLADESFPDSRRRDMASALSSLAKALGRPAETISADPATLRPLLAGLTPAMVRMTAGRWRNVLSLTTAALAHFGLVVVQGRIRRKPSPGWLAILGPLQVGAEPHFHLWRFARYCSQGGIDPDTVDDTMLATYQHDLETSSLVADPARSAREAARSWNAAAVANPAWPQRRLTVPDNRRSFAPGWESLPESLTRDIDALCEWLGGTDPFVERPFVPLRPPSVATRRRQIRAYLGALVQKGIEPHTLVDLATAVTPVMAELALRFFWDRAGKQRTVHLHQMAGLVVQIARHWAKLPPTDVERLVAMANQLKPMASGMTSRNIARLRALEEPERLEALLNLPSVLLADARRVGAPSIHSARLVQAAVQVEILLHVPMRPGNLRHLRIGVHLLRSDGAMFIWVPADQVKNGVAINASLPPEAAKLVGLYIDRYRPLLAIGGGDWLFPSATPDLPKSEAGWRSQIQTIIADRCGLQFHPHLFRHMAAWMTLRENPDAHGMVQRILGHKSLASTMSFYSGLETPAALQHYDALIAKQREATQHPARPDVGRGRR